MLFSQTLTIEQTVRGNEFVPMFMLLCHLYGVLIFLGDSDPTPSPLFE